MFMVLYLTSGRVVTMKCKSLSSVFLELYLKDVDSTGTIIKPILHMRKLRFRFLSVFSVLHVVIPETGQK